MHFGEHHHAGGGASHSEESRFPTQGHNGPRPTAQWQTPHRTNEEVDPSPQHTKDLDLVEATFVEGYSRASDPASFLRLAGVPTVGGASDGRHLHLLRVEIEDFTDVGVVTPILGGGSFRYDPLTRPFVSRRRKLAFAYHDGKDLVRLDFAATRALADFSGVSYFPTPKADR